MRKIALLCAAGLCLALANCSSTQVATLDTVTTSIIQGVQDGTAAACKILPEAGSIAAIFNASAGATVSNIVSAVCGQAPVVASARYRALPQANVGAAPAPLVTINGVVVTGWRTQ